jgi:hypothetical protein
MLFSKGIVLWFNTFMTAPEAPPPKGGLLGIKPSPRINSTFGRLGFEFGSAVESRAALLS